MGETPHDVVVTTTMMPEIVMDAVVRNLLREHDAWMLEHHPPLKPPTRWQRLRWRTHGRIIEIRHSVASRICPHEDY